MTPDIVNGCFELVGAYFTWANFRAYHRVRKLQGVYWPTTGFFTAWGVWNLFYYPSIGQPLSFLGGCVLMLGNAAWIGLVLKDKLRA